MPLTCVEAGAECGEVADTCGGTTVCPPCADSRVCVANSCEDAPDPPWVPLGRSGATRASVFYQFDGALMDVYADPVSGLPRVPGMIHVFAVSHGVANASRRLGDRVHAARDDFRYAPCFDMFERVPWRTADEPTIAGWAREYREDALEAHADFFCFNEAPSGTAENADTRRQMMRMLQYLNEPAPDGRVLRGVFFMTERAVNPVLWGDPTSATGFWERVDATCEFVVAEHYHGQGFICSNTLGFLRDHFFAIREWLMESGNAAKVRIAGEKFVVLHSARYGPGPSGWQGADSGSVSLAAFQRNLSRAAMATRTRTGGFNRISFAPVSASTTDGRVHPRIALLMRWHYGQGGEPIERECVASAPVNCECD